MPITLTDRERATMLAALRYWQLDLAENLDEGPIAPDHFDKTVTPLTVEEIEALCERLNSDQAAGTVSITRMEVSCLITPSRFGVNVWWKSMRSR